MSEAAIQALRGVLLDLDGTLAPSDQHKFIAHLEAIAELGGSAVAVHHLQGLLGKSRRETIDNILRLAGLTAVPPQRYSEIQMERFTRHLSELQAHPGVVACLRHLKQEKIRIAVVTSSMRSAASLVLRQTELMQFVDVLITSDDVEKTHVKPHPEPYHKALSHLNITAQQAVALEDSYPGLISATDAGLRTIAVGHELNAAHDFSLASATVGLTVYSNPERFLELLTQTLCKT